MIKDTKLPPGFKNWMHLFRELQKEAILINQETISFAPMGSLSRYMEETSRLYYFDVDYIKARCFDELKAPKFTVTDYEKFMYALINMHQIKRGDGLDDKIKDAIGDLYEMGEY